MTYRVVILGAGISGLATAWFLKKSLGLQIHLTILEKSSRSGGWIQTTNEEGFLFEGGPRSCRTKGKGANTLALVQTLGLQSQVITPHSDAHQRYIYFQKRLHRLPRHIWEIPFSPLTKGWLKAFWKDLRADKRKTEDESIASFFTRRFGQAWADQLIDPFVSGIYAGDCERLSLKSCFPQFDSWEQEKGSLIRGALHRHSSKPTNSFIKSIQRSPLFSFKNGMHTLPKKLAEELQSFLHLEQQAVKLTVKSDEMEILLHDGRKLVADHVISTVPPVALSQLLSDYPALSKKLDELSYASICALNLGYHKAVLPQKGFGYLVPSKENSPVLGCVWDSCIFPEHNQTNAQTRLTVMLGGSRHLEITRLTEVELLKQALTTLNAQCGLNVKPDVVKMHRAIHAIPQYEIGYQVWKTELQDMVKQTHPQLTLSGNAFTGVSINDCITEAKRLSEQLTNRIR